MARLYYNFHTNAEKEDEDYFAPHPELFMFKLADGRYMEIQLSGDGDMGLEDHVADGRWKGLEYIVYDKNEEEEWEENDNTADFYNLLEGAKLIACGFDYENIKGADDDNFVPTCTNCCVSIEAYYFDENDHEFEKTFEFEEKELITDKEWIDSFRGADILVEDKNR